MARGPWALFLISCFIVIAVADRGPYFDNIFRTWNQSSQSCQQLGAWDDGDFSVKGFQVPQRPPNYPQDQFFWIGARVQQTPWFTHLGCYETPTAPEKRDISNEKFPTFSCYLFCASFRIYFTMGISEKTCYCYDNVDNYRKLGSEQCYYQDFPNSPDELYGAPNPGSVVVFKYHQTRPVAAENDFGNCASFRFFGTQPIGHAYSSCLNRLGRICENGQISISDTIPWTEAVKRCGKLQANFNGYYYGLTESVKYYSLWTGFYRRSIEKWTPPSQDSNLVDIIDNLHSSHCVAVKVNNDGTLYQITYPQLCTKSLPTLCEKSTRVDGNWASWGVWSQCPVTCGGGTIQRSRECTDPPPKHGGSDCVGDAVESKPCNTNPCPVDGNWSSWSPWGNCSSDCGKGEQWRSRECNNPKPEHNGKDCEGDERQRQECIGCPFKKELTLWTPWSTCSVTCGKGIQSRSRRCDLKDDEKHLCGYEEKDERECNTNIECPIDGNWSDWSTWGECSKTCGHGEGTRIRTCANPPPQHGGKDCPGVGLESMKCIGCPGGKTLTPWTAWGQCSVSCGSGEQSRFRECDLTPAEQIQFNCTFKDEQKKPCKMPDCPIDGGWSAWSAWGKCSNNCGRGQETRTRTCTNPPPQNGGADCVGSGTESRDCIGCPGGKTLTPWTAWGQCSVSCGSGEQSRFRECDLTPAEQIQFNCTFKDEQKKPCKMPDCPINGGWSPWSAWGKCSNTCGRGQETRTRTCTNPPPQNGGADCVGSGTESRDCIGCPGGKTLTPWSAWGQCSVSCGSGEQSRFRECDLTPAEQIQFNCTFKDEQKKPCKMPDCPIDGGWSPWSAWGKCSNTCGRGQETRTRTCTNPPPQNGGADCVGSGTESRDCIGCPGGKTLTPWTAWGQCSVSCGSGEQSRFRECDLTPAEQIQFNCTFKDEQKKPCKMPDCPINGGWSPWSAWGKCSNTCGRGQETRTRTCTNPPPQNGGADCVGSGTESRDCIGCPGVKTLTPWSAWGQCSVSCGSGEQSRFRECDLTPAEQIQFNCTFKDEQKKPCKMPGCPIDGGWSPWSAWGKCSNTCGRGQETRTRTCTNPPPQNGGADCVGSGTESRDCIGCPGGKTLTPWTAWGQCSVSCGSGEQSRFRECDLTPAEQIQFNCTFKDEQKKPCKMPDCPIDGGWSPWSAWGKCSNTCGRGQETRTRTCTNPPPQNGGADCVGSGTESRDCIGCPGGKTLTPWTAWGQCSVSCGSGEQSRFRECDLTPAEQIQFNCTFKDEQKKPCKMPDCPIDGGWSPWSAWGKCSNTCGRGQETRTRTCTNPPPQNGGADCVGSGTESRDCIGCPGGKTLTPWTAWGQCSVSCGSGEQSRFRECDLTPAEQIQFNCTFKDEQKKPCKMPDCPIDGGWSPWSAWGKCSNTCGRGQETRTRTCTNPPPQNGGADCVGSGTESRDCIGCPGGKTLTPWTAWGQCSVSCGSGEQSRFRECDLTPAEQIQFNCTFKEEQKQPCKIRECPIDGNWGPWSMWSECCVNSRSRIRECNNPPPQHGGTCHGTFIEGETCFGCPGTWPDPVWTAWSDCSVTCGFGEQRRTRSCELPIASRIKYKCFTRETETKNCSKVQCIGSCVSDCKHWVNGHYQSCETCNGYVSCANQILYKRSCPANLVWDDQAKQCLYISTTCPPPITTPKTNKLLRMKRSVEMNAESTRLTNISLETNTKRWVLLGSSFIGGVMIVASLLVIIKLRRQSRVVYHSVNE
nr:SCO-spondin isoform X4 [Crassostrea gigas]